MNFTILKKRLANETENIMHTDLHQNILNKRQHTKFHMPGHKGRMLGEIPWVSLDTTELDGTDNLNEPKKEIKSLEGDISGIYGSKKSMICVNGATCSIMASMLGTFDAGDEIIVPRNVHKSVYSALYYGRFSPVYVFPDFENAPGYPLGVNVNKLQNALDDHPKAKGLVITYPTYYGACDDISAIVKLCRERSVILIVDEAHGAHFHFGKTLPISALDAGADIVIHSTHKTLSSLNQGSLLHINSDRVDEIRIRRHMSMLQTSSPSYPILLSVADSVRWMEENGTQITQFLDEMYRMVRDKAQSGPFPMARDLWEIDAAGWDPTKLWFSTGGMDGLSAILSERFCIDVEWEDGKTCLAMSGVGSMEEDFVLLVEALDVLSAQAPKIAQASANEKLLFPKPGKKVYELFENKESETIQLEEAAGRVAAVFLTPYPPGIPVVCPGEVIREEAVEYIRKMGQKSTLGLDRDGRIQVCKEER